jgi:hypothetical protein
MLNYMKNLKIAIVATLTLVFGVSSCIKHEVIPAPVPMVDLSCHFIGTVNGTTVELTENVLGYYCTTSKAKILLPSPSLSSASYFSQMLSSSTPVSAKIALGSVMWDAATAIDPDVAAFNAFHGSNLTPNFSTLGATGFEFSYRDGTGVTWTSKSNSVNFQDVTFSSIVQESDTSGDYSKFKCNFECYVYHTDAVTLVLDSIHVQGAQYEAWFKR